MKDWEPLLQDDRVGKIADLLRLAVPELPMDTEVFSFIVPEQPVADRRSQRFIPHEPGCPYRPDNGADCDCGPYVIPEQAVFAVKSPNPRAGWDPFYKGKSVMDSSGMWRRVWEREEKANKHYVSTREDPAWAPFLIAARAHVRRLRDYRELI